MEIGRQNGAALLVTVIIILVLSVIAVTATNTNQMQQLLVRNNQQQLLVFNASYDELRSQIDVFERFSQQGIDSDVIEALVAKGRGASIEATGFSQTDQKFSLRLESYVPDLNKSLQLTFRRMLGRYRIQSLSPESEGQGGSLKASEHDAFCYEFELLADTTLNESTVRSRQHRVFEWVVIAPDTEISDGGTDVAFTDQNTLLNVANDMSSLADVGALTSLHADEKAASECDASFTCRCFTYGDIVVIDNGKRFFKKSWWEAAPY